MNGMSLVCTLTANTGRYDQRDRENLLIYSSFLPNQFFYDLFFHINTTFFPFVTITSKFFINMDVAQDADCNVTACKLSKLSCCFITKVAYYLGIITFDTD